MDHPILKLEASAGSGKTYRLALEYIGRLLLAFAGQKKASPEASARRQLLGSILAITFTVKAAQEMKARIVSKLKRFALSTRGGRLEAEDEEFLGRLAGGTGLARERIIGLSCELIEMVMADYDDFNVMTIDSLMSAMVKVVAPDLDLPADYEIAVDARDELEARGRLMLAGLADGDWPRLEAFLEEFDRLSAYRGWQADAAVTGKLSELFRRTLRQGEAGTAADAEGLRERMATGWLRLRDALGALHRVMREEAGSDGWSGNLSRTYTTGKLRKGMEEALGKGDGFPGLETLLDSPFFRKPEPGTLLLNKASAEFSRRFVSAYRPAQQALGGLAPDFCAFKTLPYREFLKDFAAAWDLDKETLFVEEFSRVLSRLFDTWLQEAFPYLYLKLSDRFRNFLFDEFQDTSTLQFKALAPLIDEVLSREAKASLFVVGDRKQAIYRWRGGNSELMEEERLRREIPAIGHLSAGGFSETLAGNWRSLREIVRFNNEFWEPGAIAGISAEAGLREAILANFAASRQELPTGKKREGGYVELSLRLEAGETGGEGAEGAPAGEEEDGGRALSAPHLDEIERIIRRLTAEHGYAPSDIAVLVRKNDQVRAVIRRLGRRGISSISDQSLLLSSNPRVNEIIAFLRFLDYPPDDLNFHAFVGGEIFLRAAAAGFPGEAAALSDEAFLDCQGPFYKLFQDRFPGCWRTLVEPFFQSVGFLPPYDVFSDVTQAFRVYENFPGDTPFLMALGDALHRAERDGGSSIAGFLRRWEQMVADEETPVVAIPENAPGVRVLTMHQSKGLEFPAVILPLNDKAGRNDPNPYMDEEGLFYINSSLAQSHPALKEKYQQENIRASIDLLNLLYVAFTRAREALFVPVAVGKGIGAPAAARDGLVRRISRASDAVGRHPLLAWHEEKSGRLFTRGDLRKMTVTEAAKAPPAAIPSKKVSTRSWQSRYLVFKRSELKAHRERAGAGRGERLHDLLSRLGEVGDAAGLAARIGELAAAARWPEADLETVRSYLCRDDVLRILNRCREFHSEKEIVDTAGEAAELRRLDRLQVGPQEVLVLDFKTGREKSAAHAAQVRGYLAAVRPLFPGRACRGYLLYIDRGEVEEVACSS
jgi:ATP-dependent helicase/nuclease subunit A